MTRRVAPDRQNTLTLLLCAAFVLPWSGCGLSDVGADKPSYDNAKKDGDDKLHTGEDAGDQFIDADTSSPDDPPDTTGVDSVGEDTAAPKCGVSTDCKGPPPACQKWSCEDEKCVTVPLPDSASISCDLGLPCQPLGFCLGGACAGASDPCDDANPCTDDACADDICQHVANLQPCDDGDPCTVKDTCEADNTCQGAPKDCDDANVCTTDACEGSGDCAHLPTAASCTDNNKCTAETCSGGKCVATVLPCDDGDVCTDDACSPDKGCLSQPNTAPCDDGDPCTLEDHCDELKCSGLPTLFAHISPVDKDANPSYWSDVLVDADGTATFYGGTIQKDGKSTLWRAQRINPVGKVLWMKTQTQKTIGMPRAATLTDGSHLLVGARQNPSTGSIDGVVKRIVQGDKVMGSWTYGGPQNDAFGHVAPISQDAWLLVGSTQKQVDGDNLGWIVQTGPGGKIAHESTPGGSLPSELMAAVTATTTEVAVVCGDIDPMGDGDQAWLLGLNADLSVKWQRILDDDSTCRSLQRRPDGSLLWLGHEDGATVNAISPRGAPLWRLPITPQTANLYSLALLGDGSAMAVGMDLTTNLHLLGVRVSAHGTVLDSFNWAQAKKLSVGFRVKRTTSGRLWIASAVGTDELPQPLALRVSAWGQKTCDEAGACGGAQPTTCDDANPCTDNSCDPKVGCLATASTATCDDGDPCTVDAACEAGSCKAGHDRMFFTWFESETISPAKPLAPLTSPLITTMPDGGYTMALTYTTAGNKSATRLLRLSSAAKVLWKKNAVGKGSEFPLDIASTPKGGVVVGGLRDGTGFLSWISPTGKLSATVTTGGQGAQISSLTVLPTTQPAQSEPSVLAIGEREVLSGGDKVEAMLWVRGGPAGVKTLTHVQPGVDLSPRSLLRLEDETSVVAGTWNPQMDSAKAWITNLDKDGKTLWSKTYMSIGSMRPIAGMVGDSSGGFVIAATTGDKPAKAGTVVFATTRNGDLRWKWEHTKATLSWPGALTVLPGGGVVVLGNKTDSLSNLIGSISTRLSSAGELLDETALSLPGSNLPSDITQTKRGDLVVAMHSEPKQIGKFWAGLVLLDPWSHISCNSAGACASLAVEDCDDGLSCTRDGCDPQKGCSFTADAIQCEDGDFCTVQDTCQKMLCTPGAAINCDDNLQCTLDACNKKVGCTHKSKPYGSPCSDGALCDVNTICNKGVCGGGKPKDCNDNLTCTIDACESKTGKCLHQPKDSACDDNLQCTLDVCDPQTGCDHQAQKSKCNDGIDCTTDLCDLKKGCLHQAVQSACDDGVKCSVDTCSLKKGCLHDAQNNQCDDGIKCSTDLCDLKKGCLNKAQNNQCNDGIDCTTDLCDLKKGCLNQAVQSACDDGVKCSVDTCNLKKGCLHDAQKSQCDDSNECTVDLCDLQAKGCTHKASKAACDDGNECTTDTCENKKCAHQFIKLGLKCSGADQGVCAKGKCITPKFKSIAVGEGFSCALNAEGKSLCWGLGELCGKGQGGPDQVHPTYLSAPQGGVAIFAGAHHVCVLNQNKTMACWGGSKCGEVIPGQQQDLVMDPEEVPGASSKNYLSLSLSYDHTCMLAQSGESWCYGSGEEGQLGKQAMSCQPVASHQSFKLVEPDTAISANRWSDCVLHKTGHVWCVGSGVGVGNPFTSQKPVVIVPEVTLLYSSLPDKPLTNIIALRRGPKLQMAIDNQGQLYAWGSNTMSYPTWNTRFANPITTNKPVSDAAAGHTHACIVDTPGDVWCWGASGGSVLGKSQPPIVPGKLYKLSSLEHIKMISAWGDHTCALRVDGTIFCWGANTHGQCGGPLGKTALQPPMAIANTGP